ncbi:hypothetical protein BDZ85DRAFT_111184 [Elsinoe ampelina]|uniref:Uncharacterized protein n=1 Tax=Elsinoe ampelina TaxID=302913 RepID=A0A6A6GD75_9PEZI|nr:hypothetical protein BDZ85DRAFT_111184 [Elsinoe ampelina]
MDEIHHWKTIAKSDFDRILKHYPAVIPDKLKDLDQKRLIDIPKATDKRRHSKEGVHLTKDEVVTLVKWKLSHGTFRPRLLSLASSNNAIPATTAEAFALLPSHPPIPAATAIAALKQLTSLSGIGPATASLLLSTVFPDELLFFSDELFRWVTWDDEKGGTGWDRKIGYTVKEYELLIGRVAEIRQRLGVAARDIECVAYVLGKTKGEGIGGEQAASKSEQQVRGEEDADEQSKQTEHESLAKDEYDPGDPKEKPTAAAKSKSQIPAKVTKPVATKAKPPSKTKPPTKRAEDDLAGPQRRSKRLKPSS